jgi:hypothetical protein
MVRTANDPTDKGLRTSAARKLAPEPSLDLLPRANCQVIAEEVVGLKPLLTSLEAAIGALYAQVGPKKGALLIDRLARPGELSGVHVVTEAIEKDLSTSGDAARSISVEADRIEFRTHAGRRQIALFRGDVGWVAWMTEHDPGNFDQHSVYGRSRGSWTIAFCDTPELAGALERIVPKFYSDWSDSSGQRARAFLRDLRERRFS